MEVREKPGRLPEWFEQGRIRWAWGGWEPPEMYRRAGSLSGGVNGRALWAHRWWDYLHSEEHVAQMASIGINLITVHYYKGFGLVAEEAEQQRTRELVDLCHRHGIHVLGYCQHTTVYPEAMLDEIPDLRDHVQYDPEGELRYYGKTGYFRWQGDMTSDTFIDYLKRVVTHGLTEIGLDGVEWDGTQYNCHCARCLAAFREFLGEEYAGRANELFGLPHFDHVLSPPRIAGNDPIYQAWLHFRVRLMHDRLRELYAHTKSVKDDAIFATYPHTPQFAHSERDRTMPPVGDYMDLATSETHEMPRVEEDGRLVCNARHLKQCSALKVPSFMTSWILYDGGYRAPQNAQEVKLSIAESACYGGHPFPATWANRPWGRDGRTLYLSPERGPALRQYMRFLADHEEIYAGSRSLANVGVLYSTPSTDFDRDVAKGHLQGLEQVLLQHQIPFGIVFDEHGMAEAAYDLICVPNQRLLSDELCDMLRAYLHDGGALLLTGEPGRYDAHYRERAEDALQDLYEHERVTWLEDGPERAPNGPEGRPTPLHPYLPAAHETVALAVRQALPAGLPADVHSGRYVGTGVYRTAGGSVAVHLLNYANREPTAVTIRPGSIAGSEGVELVTPDEGTSLHGSPDGTWTIRVLDTYAVVLFPAR